MPDLLSINGLSKAYAGVSALRDVTFSVEPSEIHALCGENGAGKSTLIKCLAGAVVPDKGTVKIQGRELRFGNVMATEQAGVAVIHQESTTFPDLNVVDNIFVGREPKNRLGLLDGSRMRREAQALMTSLGQSENVLRVLRDLSPASKQMVTIARALSRECRLLIMDEPTASLSAQETDVLLSVVKRLRAAGVGILYVSHRLSEVFEIADRVTVLRDGGHVGTWLISDIDEPGLIRQMVGRTLDTPQRARQPDLGEVLLEVRNLSAAKFTDVTFSVRRGEIVGLAGLVGAGRSELARSIVGLEPYSSGEVWIDGNRLVPNDVQAAFAQRIALVPEDRQHEGLVLPMSVSDNLTLAALKQLTRHGLIDRSFEENRAKELAQQVDVRCSSMRVATESLSGGNQQKVVIGKWLATQPEVLILDEPTRGVDVGAKAQVHQQILELAGGPTAKAAAERPMPPDGKRIAVLVISSEFPELLAVCDRILVMREGRIAGEITADSASQEHLLELALPVSTTPSE